MPLYDPNHKSTASPTDAASIVHGFLQRCLQWAEDEEIPKTLAKLESEPDLQLAARLHRWTVYREFTLHTLKELEDGTLDPWLQSDPKPDE